MYLELFSYVDGDENCEEGEYLGYVTLEEDDVYIDIDDEKLAEELEQVFSEPITYTDSNLGEEVEVEPYTRDFFRVVPMTLVDMNIRARLKDDDTEPYVKRNPDEEADEEADEEEEIEEGAMEMTIEEIEDLDEEYDELEDDDLGLEDDEDSYN